MVTVKQRVWVATSEALFVFDSEGRLQKRHAVEVTDLAVSGRDGWALGAGQLWSMSKTRLRENGVADSSAVIVDSDGGTAGAIANDVIRGRFGPNGELRTVIARKDGAVMGLDGSGQIAFVWRLRDAAFLAAHDNDDDGSDELMILVKGQGVARVNLSMP